MVKKKFGGGSKITINWQGQKIEEAFKEIKVKSLIEAGIEVQRETKLNMQRQNAIRTGRAINSVVWETRDKEGEIYAPATDSDRPDRPKDADTCIVGSNVEYFRNIEEGTRRMAPRPSLRAAFDGLHDKIERIFKDNILDFLNRNK